MSCGNSSVFGNQSQYIKFQNSDIVAIEGVNTVERLIGGDIRIPYKQLLKSRIILKAGQVNYLLNHLGIGDNATFLVIITQHQLMKKIIIFFGIIMIISHHNFH